ncbi:helix-turn-helix domain-containing protein [Nocardia sp. NPDC051030]|uniref:PucR family transcriptional regulator n=1 Tax=Nocardia sp. NPDC051030 TaxID=3155162 RepID=UPI003415836D
MTADAQPCATVPPDDVTIAIARWLSDDIDGLVDAVAGEIEQCEPAYHGTHAMAPERLRADTRENLVAIIEHLTAGRGTGASVAVEIGRRRADQAVPLSAVLRAYRIGTRVLWERLPTFVIDEASAQQSLVERASAVWHLLDEYSEAITTGYRHAMLDRTRRDAQARDAALDGLLSGDAASRLLNDHAEVLRLPAAATYVVVSACFEPAVGEAIPGIGEALGVVDVRSAWRIRSGTQIGLVALRDGFTVDRLAEHIAQRLHGRAGISSAFTHLGDAHRAVRQAELACASSGSATGEVVWYDEALIPVLLAGEPEVATGLVQRILGRLLDLPEHDRSVLFETMRLWFALGADAAAVASQLYCHRNTVRFRLNRITDLTGRRFSHPVEAAELYLALQATRISSAH